MSTLLTTSDNILRKYSWININRSEYTEDDDAGYLAAVNNLNLELTELITLYSTLFSPECYREFTPLMIDLMVAHHKYLEDENCLRISTALKQLESGKNLSLDDVLVKNCGCDDKYLSRSTYGQQLLLFKRQFTGYSMFVI